MKVLKFGGKSLQPGNALTKALEIIEEAHEAGDIAVIGVEDPTYRFQHFHLDLFLDQGILIMRCSGDFGLTLCVV